MKPRHTHPFVTGPAGSTLARFLEEHGPVKLARWTGLEINRLRSLAFLDGHPEPEERAVLSDILGISEGAWS